MTVHNVENTKLNQTSTGLQTFVFRFVVVTAILLVALPILPMLISNLVYSFSGASPKIYWYLSRASGFVTLSILWISMALGLGITNKMTRIWPGAPTAFATHQFTSLLGLAFAAYHALVLMGDHYTDFSLPRLAMPFSIGYLTFWIGLGQLCFYVWILAVVSFYFRQRIGQKTWRLIHYVNFAVYSMGFLHGLKSGTDSNDAWAVWYFAISGFSIMILLGFRITDSLQKRKITLPRIAVPQIPIQAVTERVKTSIKALPEMKINILQARILWEQAKKLMPRRKKASEMILDQVETRPVSEKEAPIQTLEATIAGKKIRVRIFKEPQLPSENESNSPSFSED
jgi:hypothetical protein